jgi:PPOX class probable FMN-dependent enzyme
MEAMYKDLITSAEELRNLVGVPNEAVVKKSIAQIDDHIRNYLLISPLFFLSTASADGRCDVSPRGDAPGSVHVLDDKRLIYAERPGNRRIDSLLNIISNPQVGMLFVIPGQDQVLRINGKAYITQNEELLQPLLWNGNPPKLGVIVEVQECFVHCPRALKQASLWDTESWLPEEARPSIQAMFQAHLKINGMTVK